MLLTMNPKQYCYQNSILTEPVKNQMYNESTFMRLLYSTNTVTTNGICLLIDIKDISIERKFSKQMAIFKPDNYRELVASIVSLEEHLLEQLVRPTKRPVYSLKEAMLDGRLIVHNFITPHIVLKISGVWETDTNYGVTYKFVYT